MRDNSICTNNDYNLAELKDIFDDLNINKNFEDFNKDSFDNNSDTETSIDINSVFIEALMKNKVVIFATLPLFMGYYLQDTIFTRSIAKVTSNVPEFVEDISVLKVFDVMIPYIASLMMFYISNIITARATYRIETYAVHNLTDKLVESVKTSKKQINVNDLILHIKKIGDTKNIYSIIMTYIVPTIIIGVGLIYNFSKGDTLYSLIVIMLLVTITLITTKLELDSIQYAHNTEKSVNVVYDDIHELMTNIDSVLTSNTQKLELENLSKTKKNTYNLQCQSSLNNNNTTYGLQTLNVATVLGINYLSYRLYSSNRIDSALFTATILMSMLFMDYYNYCIYAIADLINSMGRYKEMREYFKEFKIIKQLDTDRLMTLKITKGNISIKNIFVRYDGKSIFSNFSLNITGNSITGLVGAIGSGKTTLLKLLAGIVEHDGDVLIDNHNLKDCTFESIVDNIAYISQHPKLFNKSIYYNLNYGSAFTKKEISVKLDKLGLTPFIDSFPKKLDTVVGKEGNKVSGGQRQFLSLIRAIIQNKSILLLDEPSSSLDSTNKDLFIKLIKLIKPNKTIIVSTHDSQLMSLFDVKINVTKEKMKSCIKIN